MKRMFLLSGLLLLLGSGVLSAETIKTGDKMDYFPIAAPMVGNKNGDRSSSFISKIAKAAGYSDGYYELQVTSVDWIGASVFPVTFSYIVKKDTVLEFVQTKSIYTGAERVKVIVKSVSENTIELEEENKAYGEITPSEDSL